MLICADATPSRAVDEAANKKQEATTWREKEKGIVEIGAAGLLMPI